MKNSNKKLEAEPDTNTQEAIRDLEKKKLQKAYASVFGNTSSEIKTNSLLMRRKIYMLGLIMFAIGIVIIFLLSGKVKFVTM